MVLESLEQYVQHGIEPPKTLPQMRDQYLQRVAAQEKPRHADQVNKIEEVVRLWNTRVQWWNTNFPYPPRPRPPATPVVPTYVQPSQRPWNAPLSGPFYNVGGGLGMGGLGMGGLGMGGLGRADWAWADSVAAWELPRVKLAVA